MQPDSATLRRHAGRRIARASRVDRCTSQNRIYQPIHRPVDLDVIVSVPQGEIRRVLISPKDLRRFGDRLLPARRRILFDPEGEPLRVELRNVLLNPALPARLFSHHNLMTQRFPSF